MRWREKEKRIRNPVAKWVKKETLYSLVLVIGDIALLVDSMTYFHSRYRLALAKAYGFNMRNNVKGHEPY